MNIRNAVRNRKGRMVSPVEPTRRTDRRQRRLQLVVLLGVMAVSLIASNVPAAASGGWRYFQLDGDRCHEAAARDTDGNGNWNEIWYDLDGDCRWDTRQYDTGRGDWLHEVVLFDMNEDRRWEVWVQDTNQRAGFEFVYFDDNRDGRADRQLRLSSSSFTVLSSPSYTGVSALMVTMAALHGTVA